MSKKKISPTKKQKLWPALLRLPEDWRERIGQLKNPQEPETGFIRELIVPVLDGTFAVERDATGRVVAYHRQPDSERVQLSAPPRHGKPATVDQIEIAAGQVYTGETRVYSDSGKIRAVPSTRRVVRVAQDVVYWTPAEGGPESECLLSTFQAWVRNALISNSKPRRKRTSKATR